jgi:hypothetical protein
VAESIEPPESFQRNGRRLKMPNHGVVLRLLIYLGAALVNHAHRHFKILVALLRGCLALRLFYPFGCFSQLLIDELVRRPCHHYHGIPPSCCRAQAATAERLYQSDY